jgi:hypothetical protein
VTPEYFLQERVTFIHFARHAQTEEPLLLDRVSVRIIVTEPDAHYPPLVTLGAIRPIAQLTRAKLSVLSHFLRFTVSSINLARILPGCPGNPDEGRPG